MRVGERLEANLIWSYETPFDEGEAYAGYLAFYWGRVDQWIVDDEEVTAHPKTPV